MRKITSPAAALLLAAAPAALAAPGDILFQDDFESGSIASYTVEALSTFDTGDAATYGFDYGSFGVPGVSGNGLLLETDDALTVFVNGLSVSTPISIKFDAIASAVSGGSTEALTAGVANALLPFDIDLSPSDLSESVASNGLFVGALTDSDTAGSGDYGVYDSLGGAVPTALSFMDAAGLTDTGIGFGNAAVLPEIPGQSSAGVLDGRSAEFEILVDGARLQWFINGTLITDVTASAAPTGTVGIGISDPFPGFNNGTVGQGTGTAFAIDNLLITETAAIPEPTTLGVAAAGLALLAGRRRRVA